MNIKSDLMHNKSGFSNKMEYKKQDLKTIDTSKIENNKVCPHFTYYLNDSSKVS
ncbi:MAG: hypothetical protein AB7F53_00530 [Nitrososphaeraceae archaeon]